MGITTSKCDICGKEYEYSDLTYIENDHPPYGCSKGYDKFCITCLNLPIVYKVYKNNFYIEELKIIKKTRRTVTFYEHFYGVHEKVILKGDEDFKIFDTLAEAYQGIVVMAYEKVETLKQELQGIIKDYNIKIENAQEVLSTVEQELNKFAKD